MKKRIWFMLPMLFLLAAALGYMIQVYVGDTTYIALACRPEVSLQSEEPFIEPGQIWAQAEAYRLKQEEEERRVAEEAVRLAEEQLGEYGTFPIEVTPRKPGEKVAYLTFDDGPGEYTEELLDILDTYEVKATFFVVGNRLDEEGKRILKEVYDRGHVIGIHCYDHDYNVVYASSYAYLADFYKTFDLIREVTGVRPNVWRFPGGSTIQRGQTVVREVITELYAKGFSFYDWNVSTGDGGNNSTTQSVLDNAKKTYPQYDDPVVLMHDVKKSTVNAVPQMVQMLRNDGYEFDTVDHREPVGFISVPGVTDTTEDILY